MKSQQKDLELAKSRFLASLADKANGLHECLSDYLELPKPAIRDDLRRRCHALATSARLFEMHELEETSRSAVSVLDRLRGEDREPTAEESGFLATIIERVQSLASGHQSGAYTSSAFRLAKRKRRNSSMEFQTEQQARSPLVLQIDQLLQRYVLDRSKLYDDDIRKRCEQMGAPHLGVLQRLRDGTPAQDLLADRAVDHVVLRETLEALRSLGAMRPDAAVVDKSAVDLELDLELETRTRHRHLEAPQWIVLVGTVCTLAVVIVHATSASNLADNRPGSRSLEAHSDDAARSKPSVQARVDPRLVRDLRPPAITSEASIENKPKQPVGADQEESEPDGDREASTNDDETLRLRSNEGELEILPGAVHDTIVKVRGRSYGSPPVKIALREGLHTIVFESESGSRYRFWHIRRGERRQVSAP